MDPTDFARELQKLQARIEALESRRYGGQGTGEGSQGSGEGSQRTVAKATSGLRLIQREVDAFAPAHSPRSPFHLALSFTGNKGIAGDTYVLPLAAGKSVRFRCDFAGDYEEAVFIHDSLDGSVIQKDYLYPGSNDMVTIWPVNSDRTLT
jgi:hypothetical protein